MKPRENYKIENDGIWIAKSELKKWHDHYTGLAKGIRKVEDNRNGDYFQGEADVLNDMLELIG